MYKNPFKKLKNWIAARRASGSFASLVKAGELKYAFTSGGRNFFMFVNEQRIPASRALKALDVYGELELKADRVYWDSLLAAIIAALDKGKISQVVLLVNNAQDRLKYIANFDLMYKLGAVLYVEEGEDPLEYDDEIAANKVALWQKEKDVRAFFLRTPLIEFLPFSDLSEENLQSYITEFRKNEKIQFLALFKILSESKGNDAELSRLERALGRLESLTSSSASA